MMNKSYSSVLGVNKEINQDNCEVTETKQYLVLSVADGLGSSKYSHIGSLYSVKATKKAIIEWRKLRNRDTNILLQLINFYWNLYIRDINYKKDDCQSTCLFVYIDKYTKEVIIGQLGDGMIYFKSDDILYLSENLDDFNYTKSLGKSINISDWNIFYSKINLNNFKCILATDGVSDDIVASKEEEFLDTLIFKMADKNLKSRNYVIKDILQNWLTKFHNDDKTICIAWGNK